MSAQELSNGTRSELKQWDQVIVQGQTTSEFRVRVQTLGPGRMESGVGVERTTTAYSLTACSSIATVTTVVNIKHWILNEILLHTMNNCYRHHPWVMRCTLPCSSAAERPSCTCLVSNSPHSTAAVWRTVWRHLGPSPCTTRQSSQFVRLTVICLTINNSDVETIFIFTSRHPSSKSGLMYRQLQQRTGCTTNMYKTGIQRTGARVETVNGWWLLQKILFWQTFLSRDRGNSVKLQEMQRDLDSLKHSPFDWKTSGCTHPQQVAETSAVVTRHCALVLFHSHTAGLQQTAPAITSTSSLAANMVNDLLLIVSGSFSL